MHARMEFDPRPDAGLRRESFGELLSQLASNSAALVRDELELARKEVSEKIAVVRSGIVIVAAGALVALVAILTLTAAAVIGLSNYVGAGKSALIIGGGLAIIGSTTTVVGLGRIKHTSLKPEQTIASLEEDKEWLKELT